jgi:hypothetical protein
MVGLLWDDWFLSIQKGGDNVDKHFLEVYEGENNDYHYTSFSILKNRVYLKPIDY